MRAATAVGIVGGIDVAGAHALGAKLAQDFLRRETQAADEARHALGFGDEFALGRDQSAGHVQDLVDDGALCSSAEEDEHLLGRGTQHFADDFDREGIGCRLQAGVFSPLILVPIGAASANRFQSDSSLCGGASVPDIRLGYHPKRPARSARNSAYLKGAVTASMTGTPSSAWIVRLK